MKRAVPRSTSSQRVISRDALPFYRAKSTKHKRIMTPIAIDRAPVDTSESTSKAENDWKSIPAPYSNAKHEEYQYLDLIRDILKDGEHRPDR